MLRSPNDNMRGRSGSEPDISASAAAAAGSATALRTKRRYDDILVDEFSSFRDEIRQLMASFTSQQTEKLISIEKSLAEIKKTSVDIGQSIEFLSQQYETVQSKVKTLDEQCKTNSLLISVLQEKIETLERNARAHKVEIRNLPSGERETRLDLTSYLRKLITSMNIEMQHTDIKDIYRLPGKKDLNKPLVVEMTCISTKNKFIQAAKSYNKIHKDSKLNASLAGISGPTAAVPIYIAEHLTQQAARFYYLARKLKIDGAIKHCWTADGRVLIRKSDTSPVIQIKTEAQIEEFRSKD